MTTKRREPDPNRTVPDDSEQIVERVRDRYGRIAAGELSGCGPAPDGGCATAEADVAGRIGYGADDLGSVPEDANLGLGCGAPVEALGLQPGEVVLDLGSGAGLDALLAARRVGPAGRVIGVDMTDEMLERARANAEKAGAAQVEFRKGRLEHLPLDDASVDAVTSNCVINLVPDKRRVFDEIARVLRPGGRLVISDIVLDGPLPDAVERDLLAYVGCVAGAMQRATYFETVERAGLGGVRILKDIDFLGVVGDTLPAEVQALVDRTGVRIDDVRGRVRSVTFSARKS